MSTKPAALFRTSFGNLPSVIKSRPSSWSDSEDDDGQKAEEDEEEEVVPGGTSGVRE